MKSPQRLLVALSIACCLVTSVAAVRADDANLSYDDPSIHYTAPDGWTRIDLSAATGQSGSAGVVAAFTKTFGRYDQRAITLKIEDYSGGLDEAEGSYESEMRGGAESVFVDRKTRVTMPNGMPAWFMKISIGSEAGNIARIFQYVIVDGKRRIVASYSGRAGYFDEKDATSGLSGLAVVLYPQGR